MKPFRHLNLQRGIEIGKGQIAAADEIECSRRRVMAHILLLKAHGRSECRQEAEAFVAHSKCRGAPAGWQIPDRTPP